MLTTAEVRSHQRVAWIGALSGLVAKAILFSLFFWWARSSEVGAAALRGAVYADAFTFLLLGIWEWPFRRAQITLAGVFETALVVLYLNRTSVFGIERNISILATSLLVFFVLSLAKTAVWTAERALGVTGARAPASP